MKNQLRRLSRALTTVAVMALIVTVAAPDVSAQSRGRVNDQEVRTSGRSTTAKQSKARNSRAGKSAVRKSGTSKTTQATSRARSASGRATNRNKSAAVTNASPQKMSKPNGSRNQGRASKGTTRQNDRGSRTASSDRTRDRGGKATKASDRGSKGDRGSRATRDRGGNDRGSRAVNDRNRDRGSRATNAPAKGKDRVVERNRRNRPYVADRTRAGRRSTVTGRRSKYYPPIVKPNRRYRYNRRYNRYVHVSSHLHLGLTWPWQYRYRRHWAPRYRYRQVVYVNVGWGANRRSERVDVSTTYSHRIIEANRDFAEIEITLENVDIHQGGYYLGYVDRIPNRVGKIRATVWADGTIEFDKNVFIVGDRSRGFEMIATRNYNDYLLNAYREDHRLDVARIDLRRHRAKNVRRSRLFKPNRFNGYVPISLLPEDDRLWDYRNNSLSDWEDDRYRNRDLSLSYQTESGLDVEMRGETYLEQVN